jgi:hypothetical protein
MEPEMSAGQIAYLIMVVAGYALLMVSLAWATLYTQLDSRRFREQVATARKADAARLAANGRREGGASAQG